MNKILKILPAALAGICCTPYAMSAQEKPATDPAELAKKLPNPVASIISLPFQNNTDVGIDTYKDSKNTLNPTMVLQ